MAGVDQNGFCDFTALQASSVLFTDGLHDLAQPLTVLVALLDEAGQAAEPALAGDYLAIARSECHRALAVVRSLQVLLTRDGANIDTDGPR